jgi:hypothetical protein
MKHQRRPARTGARIVAQQKALAKQDEIEHLIARGVELLEANPSLAEDVVIELLTAEGDDDTPASFSALCAGYGALWAAHGREAASDCERRPGGVKTAQARAQAGRTNSWQSIRVLRSA